MSTARRFLSSRDTPLFFWIGVGCGVALVLLSQWAAVLVLARLVVA